MRRRRRPISETDTAETDNMNRVQQSATWLLAVLLLIAAVATFALSLNHPITADLAMLHYSAWLINEKHFALYRDIFEVNFPGPFLFHSLLGQLLGYEALPLRFVDFSLLALLGLVSWKILSPISRPAALAAPCLFILLNLVNGGEFVLERDFLALVPAAAAFLLANCLFTNHTIRWQAIGVGTLAALSCSMKPNAIVVLPVLLWLLWQRHAPYTPTTTKLQTICLFFISMAAIAAIPFLWLLKHGDIAEFIRIYKTFLPIYTNSRYDLWHYDSDAERLASLFRNYCIYSGIACLLSVPGLLWGWFAQTGNMLARRRIVNLAIITFLFTFYEAIAGKFWLNHMFPSAYWSILCFSLLLTPCQETSRKSVKIFSLILLAPIVLVGWILGSHVFTQMQTAHDNEANKPDAWRARQIAHFLQQQQLGTDDTVQMLDMAGDGQAALLMARATSSTRHLIDVPLYMQPESAANKALRQEFIADINTNKPAYIVYTDQFLHPGGGNRLKEFRELYAIIGQHYELAEFRDGSYTIYRRKTVTGKN
jgi:hypothetical protein